MHRSRHQRIPWRPNDFEIMAIVLFVIFVLAVTLIWLLATR